MWAGSPHKASRESRSALVECEWKCGVKPRFLRLCLSPLVACHFLSSTGTLRENAECGLKPFCSEFSTSSLQGGCLCRALSFSYVPNLPVPNSAGSDVIKTFLHRLVSERITYTVCRNIAVHGYQISCIINSLTVYAKYFKHYIFAKTSIFLRSTLCEHVLGLDLRYPHYILFAP
jgi:hypothetical protein